MKSEMNKLVMQDLNRLIHTENSSETRYKLFGIFGYIIQSRDLFPKNIDIKPFVNSLPLEIPVKDYLLSSRPQVIARMIKEINNAADDILYIYVTEARNFLDESTHEDISETVKSKQSVNRKKSSETNYIDNLLNKYSRNSKSNE